MLSKPLADLLYTAEEALLVPLEAARRCYNRLNTNVYSEAARIRAVTEGTTHHAGGKFAVFVIYTHGELPPFSMDFVLACEQACYNLVVVSNGQLAESAKNLILRRSRLLVERDNTGRDFGAYKDGLSVCFSRFEVGALIIANDSVYYLLPGLLSLIQNLHPSKDVVGISEVFEHHYHLSSFFMFFGSAVVGDPRFRMFWTEYVPIQTRMWAIMEGEGKLTNALLNAGYRPEILFRAETLQHQLRRMSVEQLREALILLPKQVRRSLSRQPVLTTGGSLADAVIEEIMSRNQMHAGGFMFMKFLGMPLFKRDVVYRELYSAAEAQAILRDLLPSPRADVESDLCRRCAPGRINVLNRLLFEHGYM